MRFEQGADVYTAHGDKVGEINRVVIDPKTNEVTHVVVKKGFLFTEDKVVSISLIGPTIEDRIMLREGAGDLEALPDFEETHFVTPDKEVETKTSPPRQAQQLYWYPPTATIWWHPGGSIGHPGLFYTIPPYVVQTERNIPSGTVALKEGAKVISADNEHVGDVEMVLTDPQENRATHLVISKGLLSKERKLIPTPWVSIVMSDEIHLAVSSDVIERLRDYEPETEI
jgi:uncharacterized protein YrrD